MINRTIKESLKREIRKGEAILLFGSMQTGKTTLKLLENKKEFAEAWNFGPFNIEIVSLCLKSI